MDVIFCFYSALLYGLVLSYSADEAPDDHLSRFAHKNHFCCILQTAELCANIFKNIFTFILQNFSIFFLQHSQKCITFALDFNTVTIAIKPNLQLL